METLICSLRIFIFRCELYPNTQTHTQNTKRLMCRKRIKHDLPRISIVKLGSFHSGSNKKNKSRSRNLSLTPTFTFIPNTILCNHFGFCWTKVESLIYTFTTEWPNHDRSFRHIASITQPPIHSLTHFTHTYNRNIHTFSFWRLTYFS